LLVVDGERAFVGGINFGADHLADFGPTAKQDYSLEIEGPLVATVRGFMRTALDGDGTGERWRPPRHQQDDPVRFVVRDNRRHSRDIETEYRRAIRAAREEVVIANAYFFPGYGFLRDLRQAARRGVRVSLVVQGEPDTPLAQVAARTLYRHLVEGGVRVHEYCRRPFHGKVAVIDGEWATVGSSNLDPLSLSLNLEANVFVRDRAFAADLGARLRALLERDCRQVDKARMPPWRPWHVLTRPLLFHFLRRFPDWAGLLPAHTPATTVLRPADGGRGGCARAARGCAAARRGSCGCLGGCCCATRAGSPGPPSARSCAATPPRSWRWWSRWRCSATRPTPATTSARAATLATHCPRAGCWRSPPPATPSRSAWARWSAAPACACACTPAPDCRLPASVASSPSASPPTRSRTSR